MNKKQFITRMNNIAKTASRRAQGYGSPVTYTKPKARPGALVKKAPLPTVAPVRAPGVTASLPKVKAFKAPSYKGLKGVTKK